MALILSVETATKVCSVALHDSGYIVAIKELHLDKSHAEFLVPIIKDVVLSSGLKMSELKAIAFSEGPGSYTGLRIGSSTVKGLCYALDIPLISVPTLEAMANQIHGSITQDVLLCPMLDARRMEVYSALYDSQYQNVMAVQPVIIAEDSFAQNFEESQIVFFGNGAAKCKGVINDKAIYIDNIHPSAKSVGVLGYEKYLNNDFEDVAYFEPFYLKEFRPTTPKMKSF